MLLPRFVMSMLRLFIFDFVFAGGDIALPGIVFIVEAGGDVVLSDIVSILGAVVCARGIGSLACMALERV